MPLSMYVGLPHAVWLSMQQESCRGCATPYAYVRLRGLERGLTLAMLVAVLYW